MTTKTAGKCDASKLKAGTKFSRISYGTIIRANPIEVVVRNEEGTEWNITPNLVETEFFTPDQFDKVEEVNRTQMVQAIINNPRIVMTVTFRKQVDPKELKAAVIKLLDDEKAGRTRPGPRKLSSLLKEATEGDLRTMIGRHYGNKDEYGRLQFTDMEVTSGIPLRQVDPRTVEEAIIANVKYVLKG